jgi:hypothetical protein
MDGTWTLPLCTDGHSEGALMEDAQGGGGGMLGIAAVHEGLRVGCEWTCEARARVCMDDQERLPL